MVDPDLARLVVSVLSPLLFGVGVAGVFARRSSLAMWAGIQVMIFASVLALLGFDLRSAAAAQGSAVGQGFGVTLVLLLAAQAVVATALLIARSRAAGRKEGSLPW